MTIETTQTSEILDRKEAARVLNVSTTTIERLRRIGKLPYIKLARKCVRYRRADCLALLDACTVRTGAANG